MSVKKDEAVKKKTNETKAVATKEKVSNSKVLVSKTKKELATTKKSAVSKLKAEVKEVKKEKQKKDLTSINDQSAENIDKSKISKAHVFTIKSNEKKQNHGKIGEIKNDIARATGHRKRAIAKVSCSKNNAKLAISVNNLDYKRFFTKLIHQNIVMSPFVLLDIKTGYVVNAEVFGGGKSGQADALKLGISRCLSLLSEEYSKILRKNSFLTRDARIVEPKKAGLKKARKKEQFSKR